MEELSEKAPVIRDIVSSYGMPPAWRREPGFSSLVYTILEQQVSLASARAVYERLLETSPELTPSRMLELHADELRKIGFSRQKVLYCKILAKSILSGELDLEALTGASDDEVRKELMAVKGVGRWTADIYLLHSLGRPDVWPAGDLALRVAVQEEINLVTRPTEMETVELGKPYAPLRSVAARVFWHAYLSRRGVDEVT